MRSSTDTLVKALRILARDIQSEDGVANAALAEAADRLAELERENAALQETLAIEQERSLYWRSIAGRKEAQP